MAWAIYKDGKRVGKFYDNRLAAIIEAYEPWPNRCINCGAFDGHNGLQCPKISIQCSQIKIQIPNGAWRMPSEKAMQLASDIFGKSTKQWDEVGKLLVSHTIAAELIDTALAQAREQEREYWVKKWNEAENDWAEQKVRAEMLEQSAQQEREAVKTREQELEAQNKALEYYELKREDCATLEELIMSRRSCAAIPVADEASIQRAAELGRQQGWNEAIEAAAIAGDFVYECELSARETVGSRIRALKMPTKKKAEA
jgi:hypothetical protein